MIADIIISAIGMFFSVFLLIGSMTFPKSNQPGVLSAAFFPRMIAVILLLLSLMILASFIMKLLSSKKSDKIEFVGNYNGMMDIVKIVSLILIYSILWILGIGHYIINSVIILICVQRVFNHGEKSLLSSGIFTVGLVVFIYYLFKFVLRVPL